MSTRSIRLITIQKVLKTWSVKGVNQHYVGSNCDAPNPGGPLTSRQPAETLVNVG